MSLYFPNFTGITLAQSSPLSHTAFVVQNKISIVTVASNRWADDQVASFISETANPALRSLLAAHPDLLQHVEISFESGLIRSLVQRLFFSKIRAGRPKGTHGNYFLVRKDPSPEIREAIGLINAKVGYVYLVDKEGKIRWAGSATATAEEPEYLTRAVERLVQTTKSASHAV